MIKSDQRLDLAFRRSTLKEALDAFWSLSCAAGWSNRPNGAESHFSTKVFSVSEELARLIFIYEGRNYTPRDPSDAEQKLGNLQATLEVLHSISQEDPLLFTFHSKPEFLETLARGIQRMEDFGEFDFTLMGTDVWRHVSVKQCLQSLKITVQGCQGVRVVPLKTTGGTIITVPSDPKVRTAFCHSILGIADVLRY